MNIFALLKSLFTSPFNRAKAQILKEMDKAIANLKKPDSVVVSAVVKALKTKLSQVLGGARLPGGGALLLQMLLANVDWNGLAAKPATEVSEFLTRLRKDVEGARL